MVPAAWLNFKILVKMNSQTVFGGSTQQVRLGFRHDLHASPLVPIVDFFLGTWLEWKSPSSMG